MTAQTTVGEQLVQLLHAHGVDTVFGIPGVHTVPLYRGLAAGPVTHITPRHEQAAAFMADGWARVSGTAGVCFLITGPGLTNAATAIAQAWSDSVPMLVVSSVNPHRSPDKGEGRLHELPDQSACASTLTAASHTLTEAQDLPRLLHDIFQSFSNERPRPVHLQIGTDLLATPCSSMVAMLPSAPAPCDDQQQQMETAAKLVLGAKRPLMIVGGGARDASKEVVALAERLDIPVLSTIAAKGVLADSHPLCVGASLGHDAAREEIRCADVVIVVGSELAPTDLWPHDSLQFDGALVRFDIDPRQFEFEPFPEVAIVGDCKATVSAFAEHLTHMPIAVEPARPTAARRVADLRAQFSFDQKFERWLQPLRKVLVEDTIITADSTQLVYQAAASFPMFHPRGWLTSVTGFGTLGYALPAAIGASLYLRRSADQRRIVCLIGDGGLQFTIAELMTASQLQVTIDVVVWNNQGYGEIRDSMLARGVEPAGVDIAAPDMVAVAAACSVEGHRVKTPQQLIDVLARPCAGPRLIDVDLR